MERPATRFAWNGDMALAHQVLGEGWADLQSEDRGDVADQL
jgi:hypothetical protein